MNLLNHIGSFVCHQDPTRTMLLGNALLPLCARCVGIYASFLFAWIGLSIVPKTRRWVLTSPLEALPAIAFLTTGLILSVAEAAKYFTLSPTERMLAGAAAGTGLALMLRPIYNQLIAKTSKGRNSFIIAFFVCCGAITALGLTSLWDTHLGYYFLILTSIGGLIFMYLVTNVNVASLILGWRKSLGTTRDMVNLAMLTAILILTEALAISLLRAVR
jgi:uncharacterized membrane protein